MLKVYLKLLAKKDIDSVGYNMQCKKAITKSIICVDDVVFVETDEPLTE